MAPFVIVRKLQKYAIFNSQRTVYVLLAKFLIYIDN